MTMRGLRRCRIAVQLTWGQWRGSLISNFPSYATVIDALPPQDATLLAQ